MLISCGTAPEQPVEWANKVITNF